MNIDYIINLLIKSKISPALIDFFLSTVSASLWRFFDKSKTNYTYNVGMFGPSRIGKTTLIAAMVEEFRSVADQLYSLDKTYLKLNPSDQSSSQRISQRINDLKSGIEKGAFKTGTLVGTSMHEIFNLRFEKGADESFQQNFVLHDFPGGWIDDPDKEKELDIKKWDVFILPTDAAAIMECYDQKQRQALRGNLGIHQVENVIRDWVRHRDGLQSLCIISPVKCETYFTYPMISPILSDRSHDLYNKVVYEYYHNVIKILKEEKNSINCLYMPVNTIGCCYLKEPTWNEKMELEGLYAISPEPEKNTWNPHGPACIMLEICKFMTKEIKKLPMVLYNKKITDFINSIEKFEKGISLLDEPFNRTRRID